MTAALFRDLVAFSIQIALVVLAVAVLVRVVRLPARVRYVGLRLVLVASLMVPWLLRSSQAPPVPETAVTQSTATVAFAPSPTLPIAPSERAAAPAGRGLAIPWIPLLVGVLLVGVVGRSLWLGVGLMRLRRMTRGAAVVEDPEYVELQAQLGTRATIAQVSGLSQPATFGVLRPIVMLPDVLAAAPAPLRRAVIIHELFHVRRRDWLFVLMEEIVRTVLWFHPAVLWLTSHIQLAREEIVDELTVRATGDRRSYMQALLTFADSGGLSPAPAFAHRRQLFHRILSVSKETVMSKPRIVTSAAVLIAVVLGASWSASSLFPIVKAAPQVTAGRQSRGEGALPTPARQLASAEAQRGTRAHGAMSPQDVYGFNVQGAAVLLDQRTFEVVTPHAVTPENPIPRRTRGVTPRWPSRLTGQASSAQVSMLVTIDRNGGVVIAARDGCSVTSSRDREGDCGAFYDAAAAAIRQWRYERPVQAPLQFRVAVTFNAGSSPAVTQAGLDWRNGAGQPQDTLRPQQGATREAGADVARAQLEATIAELRELERAQQLVADGRATGSPERDRDLAVQLQRRLAEVNAAIAALQPQVASPGDSNDLQRERLARMAEELTRLARELGAQPAAPPTPSTPFDGSPRLVSPSGRAPFRVGGAITAPRVIKHPQPAYTAEAMQARVEGTVVLEALIDEQGRVADARVLKSIPLLDDSALAAAKQWEFTPTLLNGEPVPVLVMIELDFNLRK